jgi:SNF2 family DNA or RNA helicase
MTTDFVGGPLEQGEKVIVISCFDEPLKKLVAHFGKQAVLFTGATPSRQRQKLVDRFQSDPSVRLFLAISKPAVSA